MIEIQTVIWEWCNVIFL